MICSILLFVFGLTLLILCSEHADDSQCSRRRGLPYLFVLIPVSGFSIIGSGCGFGVFCLKNNSGGCSSSVSFVVHNFFWSLSFLDLQLRLFFRLCQPCTRWLLRLQNFGDTFNFLKHPKVSAKLKSLC